MRANHALVIFRFNESFVVILRLKALTPGNRSHTIGFTSGKLCSGMRTKKWRSDSSITNNVKSTHFHFEATNLHDLMSGKATPVFDAASLQGSRSYTHSDDSASPKHHNSAHSLRAGFDVPFAPMRSASAHEIATGAGVSTEQAALTIPAASTLRATDLPVRTGAADALPNVALADNKLQPGESPTVTVKFSDQASDLNAAPVAPTVVIDKAGKLLDVNGAFDKNTLDYSKTGVPKNIVIQLQHDATDPADPNQGATDAQKQALKAFTQHP